MDHLLDSLFGEVHQHIPAEDDIHRVRTVQERRIKVLHQVEIREGDHLLDGRRNGPTSAWSSFEVCVSYPLRSVPERPVCVDPFRSFVKRPSIQVRRQNCYLPFLQVSDHPAENDCERVRLFTRGATGTPDPKLTPESVASAD